MWWCGYFCSAFLHETYLNGRKSLQWLNTFFAGSWCVSRISCSDLCSSTCISRFGCWVVAAVCRALSLQLIVTFHYCLIYREHNGLLNDSWLESSFASVWVFAYLLFCAECLTQPLSALPATQIQLTLFSGCSLVFLPFEKAERSTLLISKVNQ